MIRQRKTTLLSAAAAAALLALFSAGCQPQGQSADQTPAAGAAKSAPKSAGLDVEDLVAFKKDDLKTLDLTSKVALPTSAFIDADGKEHTMAEFKGKVVVVNMWGEWCAPCVEEMPTLAQLQKDFPGGEVVVVPVAFGNAEDRAKAADKLKKLAGGDLPFFYDSTYNVSYDLKSGNFPSTIIFNKDGKEVARLERNANWSSPLAVGLLKSILAGRT